MGQFAKLAGLIGSGADFNQRQQINDLRVNLWLLRHIVIHKSEAGRSLVRNIVNFQ